MPPGWTPYLKLSTHTLHVDGGSGVVDVMTWFRVDCHHNATSILIIPTISCPKVW